MYRKWEETLCVNGLVYVNKVSDMVSLVSEEYRETFGQALALIPFLLQTIKLA